MDGNKMGKEKIIEISGKVIMSVLKWFGRNFWKLSLFALACGLAFSGYSYKSKDGTEIKKLPTKLPSINSKARE